MQNEFQTDYSGHAELISTEECLGNYSNWIVRHFLKCLPRSPNHIIDFGAGIGTISAILKNLTSAEISCVEIDEKNKSNLKKRGFWVSDNLGLIDSKADAVFSSHVLEHIPDDRQALLEIHGSLNTGGSIFLCLPAFQFLWSEMDIEVGHYRRYQRKNLIKLVESTGFNVERCHYLDSVGFFASLALKIWPYNPSNGIGSKKSLILFDNVILPISKVADGLGCKHLFGRNIVLHAVKA